MKSQMAIGPVNSMLDVQRAFNDVQNSYNDLFNMLLPTFNTPAAGQLRFLIASPDGTIQLWKLVAGTGITLNFNTGTNECTITSP